MSLPILALAACGGEPHLEPGEAFRYPNRGEFVLELRHRGGMTGEQTRFTVYPDGRVRIRTIDRHGKLRRESRNRIPESQLRDLVEEIVSSGLARFEPETFFQRLREKGSRIPQMTDSGAVSFAIRLDLLADGTTKPESPYSHSFRVDAALLFPMLSPDEPEIRALRRVEDTLLPLWKEHRASGRTR